MTRVAIIIPSPGAEEEIASGTSEDCVAWKKYLVSNAGGAWSDDEIKILPTNPNVARVRSALDATVNYDYSIVAFSGHGKIENDQGEWITKVLLNDNVYDERSWMPDYDLRPRSQRGLLSIDSCRWDPSGQYGRTKFVNERVVYEGFSAVDNRKLHRDLFDNDMMKCERGTIMMYGCNYDEVSSGVHTKSREPGGLFTFSLLKAAFAWYAEPSNKGIFKVHQAFSHAVNRVHALQPQQNPQLEAGRRLGYFPFVIKP